MSIKGGLGVLSGIALLCLMQINRMQHISEESER